MITKYSLQSTYDKLQIEYERLSNLILKLPIGSSIQNKSTVNLNITQGRIQMIQDLVKEADN